MDQSALADRQLIRRWYRYVAAFYSCVLLLVGAAASLTADDHRAKGFSAVSNVVAGEQIGQAECAARDLRILISINKHGETRDVPVADVAAAFFTLLTARQACASGDFLGALAIYDSIAFAPDRSTERAASIANR